ncbi:glutamate/gamma-aminobutyrate family transporter YjeM [Levilactobacillus bambusae]|uniref:Glutamate/gamma-aminobutyrate family transporter YjeM n=1 Tax=Levilactobacillus bambusae TaxID=2024736 RepID=A0A2V1N2T7_9LACO|nr:glutamate/gamma-aminobutyrate family transporter YjeM [Levilactobacillus bambusae]PWG00888.1 glutamate/gamma-aminobutyrate family transporter YjeM [Levilactobacillus bambusae]
MDTKKQITLAGLVLMIFSTIYGFANTTIAFDQMGYASIIWYVFAAIFFFLPVAMMFAEYGSTFKEAKGGIYTWLSESISEKWAFIGTFIWLASWIVWMVSTSSKVWIPLSTMIFGSDKTQTWSLFGLNSTQTIGILAILWIILVTFSVTRGVDSIKRVTSVGGTFVMALTIIFWLSSLLLLVLNHGALQQPINGLNSFIQSPNPGFQSPIAVISFVVYAIFAYAGMESMGGVIDSMKNPARDFPLGMLIATGVITVLYSVSIFFWGVSTNWHQVLGGHTVNLGNITYVLMNNLGFEVGRSMGLSTAVAVSMGQWIARFTGLSMFLAYTGSFFVLTYSPLKSFILGTDPKLWPKKMTTINKNGVPAYAMWLQAVVVVIIIFFISFGGSNAQGFYQILTDMGNISTSTPYLFLVGAFPFFKRRQDLERPFVFYKTRGLTNSIVAIVMTILILGIGFTILQPVLVGDWKTAFWTVIGPVFFGAVAWIFYNWSERRRG